MDRNKPVDLDSLDKQLLDELAQQVAAGLLTQEEADRFANMIRGTGGEK